MGSDTSKSSDFLQRHKARQERCRKRLESEPADHLYFALVGTKLEGEMYPVGESAFLRVVRDAPSVFDLAAAIEDKSMLSAVDRYAPQISHELAVKVAGDDVNVTMAVAWAMTASLRIRTVSDFLVPAAAKHSWSTIAGLPADSCSVSLIEDVPRAKRIGSQRPIRADDCQWIAENYRRLIALHDEHASHRRCGETRAVTSVAHRRTRW